MATFLTNMHIKKWRNRFFKHTPLYVAYCALVVLLSIVILYKILYYLNADTVTFWYVYSLVGGVFLLSRLPLSVLYNDDIHSLKENKNYVYPKISFVIAAKNEEDSIFKTIKTCMESDYPAEMECVVIDDGSTDKTFLEMKRASSTFGPEKVIAVSLGSNKGKREAMSEGVMLSKNEIIVFVDSDSFLGRKALKLLVQHFTNEKVGAVSGNTGVSNHSTNILTKMQSIRYAISYDIFKVSESFFGVVTCCPGCFSAYRKSAILPILSLWRNQTFMGTQSTFGDDRSLTNFILRTWEVVYCKSAKAVTIVPETYSKFLKQQLRWKKSWIREGSVSASFMWKKHPVAAASFYTNLILPTLGPLVVGWVLYKTIFLYNPIFLVVFLCGVVVMGLSFSVFLLVLQRERYWGYSPLFSILYTLVMIWQMPYAILTLKKTHWGTR